MMVHLDTAFPAFEGILRSPDQIITLSAILLIPHNRRMAKRGSAFSACRCIWLDPRFSSLPHLAIHEAVPKELADSNTRSYAQSMLGGPPRV